MQLFNLTESAWLMFNVPDFGTYLKVVPASDSAVQLYLQALKTRNVATKGKTKPGTKGLKFSRKGCSCILRIW